MGCAECEQIQALGELIVPVRVGAANVEIRGCREHTGELLTAYRLGLRHQQIMASVRERILVWRDALGQVYTSNQLAVILGGSEASFTGRMLELCSHADPGNLARLKTMWPHLVLAWQAWVSCDPAPTPAELWQRISELAAADVDLMLEDTGRV